MAPDWDGPTAELWPAFSEHTAARVERGDAHLDDRVTEVEAALVAGFSETFTCDQAGKALHEGPWTRGQLAALGGHALTRLARMRCRPDQLCRLIARTLMTAQPCEGGGGSLCPACAARAVTVELIACGAVYALGDWHAPAEDEDAWQGIPTDVVDRGKP